MKRDIYWIDREFHDILSCIGHYNHSPILVLRIRYWWGITEEDVFQYQDYFLELFTEIQKIAIDGLWLGNEPDVYRDMLHKIQKNKSLYVDIAGSDLVQGVQRFFNKLLEITLLCLGEIEEVLNNPVYDVLDGKTKRDLKEILDGGGFDSGNDFKLFENHPDLFDVFNIYITETNKKK